MTDTANADGILAPYRAWNPTEDQILDHFRLGNLSYAKSDFFLLNGPSGSGKSHIMKHMLDVFDCVRVHPAEVLYMAMQLNGLPDTAGRTYAEFKTLPYGRERLIAASEGVKQKLHQNIWGLAAVWYSRAVNTEATLLTVIESNGFDYEADFFEMCANEIAGISLTSRFESLDTGIGGRPQFTAVPQEDGHWVNDSRQPVVKPYMMPLYDSEIFMQNVVYPINEFGFKIPLLEKYRK